MQCYKRQIEVDEHDLDFNGVARASALMRYIQSAAQYQLAENGLSYELLKSKKRAFILSKITMEFSEEIHAFDHLNATTFPCESRGYSFLRCYTLEKNGITVGKAASIWALIDTDTHALVRVNDFDLGLDTYTPLDLSPGRIIMPSHMSRVGTYAVTYGTVDQNRHMNNTCYPDMYSTFLPMEGKRIDRITINFLNEAPMGDTLTVMCAVQDDFYFFRTVRSDGKTNTEAEIHLTDLNIN